MTPVEIARQGRADGALDYEQGGEFFREAQRRRITHRRRAAVGSERRLYDWSYDQGFWDARARQEAP